jgi:hypothetical protein
MSGQAEHDFVKAFVNILASQPVTFPDHFQEQPEKTVKIAPVVQVSIRHSDQLSPNIITSLYQCVGIQLQVPPPPELKKEEVHPSSGASDLLFSTANCNIVY